MDSASASAIGRAADAPTYDPAEHHAAPVELRWTTRKGDCSNTRWLFIRCCGKLGRPDVDGVIRSEGVCTAEVPETMHTGNLELCRLTRASLQKWGGSGVPTARWQCCGQTAVPAWDASWDSHWPEHLVKEGCKPWDATVATSLRLANAVGLARQARPVVVQPQSLPVLTPHLLAVDADGHTIQPALPSAHGQPIVDVVLRTDASGSDADTDGATAVAVVEPPNVGRFGEEYAVAWLRHRHPGASVRWLNDKSEAQEDHDVELRVVGATEWRHVEVKTRWEGSNPRMNLMSDRQRERLQDPGDSYMLLLVGDAHRLFENPASAPRVHLYEVDKEQVKRSRQRRRRALRACLPIAVMPDLSPSLLTVDVQRRTARQDSELKFGGDDCESSDDDYVVEYVGTRARRRPPPNAERCGEQYAVAWLRHQQPTATVRWLNEAGDPGKDHDLEIRAEGQIEWCHVEVSTRWSTFGDQCAEISQQQRRRLLDPSDSYMVLLVDCVHRLFKSPPRVPNICVYESPRPSAPKMGVCVEGMLAFRFDGIYIKQADHEGRPRYENVHGKHLYCAGEPPEWLLSDSFDPAEKDPEVAAFSNAAGHLPPVGEQEWEVWDDEDGEWKDTRLKTMVLATEGEVYEHTERIRRQQEQKTDAAKAAAQRQLAHVKAVSVEGEVHRTPGLWTGVYSASGDIDGWPRFENETGKQLGYSQHRKKWVLTTCLSAGYTGQVIAYPKRTSDLEDGELLIETNDWKLDKSKRTVPLTLMKLRSDAKAQQQRVRMAAQLAERHAAAKAAAVQQLKGKAVEVRGMPQVEFNGVYIIAQDREGWPRFENAQGKHLYRSTDNWDWRLSHKLFGEKRVPARVFSVEGLLPVGENEWLCAEPSHQFCRRELTVTLLSSRQALRQQTQHLREALQAGAHCCVKQIFDMFDADCDGWLNRSEYMNYLEGLGAFRIAENIYFDNPECYEDDLQMSFHYIEEAWRWTCNAIEGCSVDKGIHFQGFEEVIYGAVPLNWVFEERVCGTNKTSKAQADLDKCKAWAAMSDSERWRHKGKGCLLPHTVENSTRCRSRRCNNMISEGDLIYRCERCDHEQNHLCEECHVRHYVMSECSSDEVREIFAMFDADRDGKLNQDEFYLYLKAVQAVPRDYTLLTFDRLSHSFDRARTDRYDMIGWPKYCKELACSPDEGITSHAFERVLYGFNWANRGEKPKHRAGLSRKDLERCKARGAMWESERQRHDSERCLGQCNDICSKGTNRSRRCNDCGEIAKAGCEGWYTCEYCDRDLCDQCYGHVFAEYSKVQEDAY